MLNGIPINESAAPVEKEPKATVADGQPDGSVKASAPTVGEQEKPVEKPAAEQAKPVAGTEAKPDDKSFVPKIEAPAEKPKLDLTRAIAELGKDGKVSDAAYKAYEDAGLSRADVDTYIAGHQARVQGIASTLSDIVGGQDNLKAVLEWAGANTPADTRDAFNAAMESGNVHAASLMVRGLAAQYDADVGTEGSRITGTTAKGVQPFQSWAQVRDVMSTKQYKTDPAFQQAVAARMRVSNL